MLGAAAQGGASLSTRPRKKGASVLNVCTFSLADLFVFVTFCTIPTWPIVSSLRRNSIFGAIEKSPTPTRNLYNPFPKARGPFLSFFLDFGTILAPHYPL